MAQELEQENFLDDPIEKIPAEEKQPVGRPAKVKLVDDVIIPEDIKEPGKEKIEDKLEDKEPIVKEVKEVKDDKIEDVVEEGLIDTLAVKLGYQFGEDEAYPDDEEGLVAFIQRQQEVGAQEIVNNYFSSVHPKAGELFDLVNMISDLPETDQEDIISDFFKGKSPELDYKSIDLKNEDVQKSVLRTYYKGTGLNDEQITKKLDKFAIAGMLEDESTEAAALLAQTQEIKSKQLLIDQKAESDRRKQSSNEYYGSLKQIIDAGKVGTFTVPVNERKSTFDYIAKGDALTALNKMWGSQEGRIQLALMLKNDFKLDKYIDQAAKTKTVNTLRDKIKQGNSKLKSSDTRDHQSTIDWDEEEVTFAKK